MVLNIWGNKSENLRKLAFMIMWNFSQRISEKKVKKYLIVITLTYMLSCPDITCMYICKVERFFRDPVTFTLCLSPNTRPTQNCYLLYHIYNLHSTAALNLMIKPEKTGVIKASLHVLYTEMNSTCEICTRLRC